MKRCLCIQQVLFIVLLLLAPATILGQGTVNFNNRVLADGIDARVFCNTWPVSGPGWIAQLWGGPAGADISALVLIGETTFREGNFGGYVNPITVTVPGVPGGNTATLQMRVVNEGIGASGASAPIQVPLGGAGIPPGLPGNLTGLTGGWGFTFFSAACIPEPSTVSLGLITLAGLLVWSCRRDKRG